MFSQRELGGDTDYGLLWGSARQFGRYEGVNVSVDVWVRILPHKSESVAPPRNGRGNGEKKLQKAILGEPPYWGSRDPSFQTSSFSVDNVPQHFLIEG
jgi:hypothetical protein